MKHQERAKSLEILIKAEAKKLGFLSEKQVAVMGMRRRAILMNDKLVAERLEKELASLGLKVKKQVADLQELKAEREALNRLENRLWAFKLAKHERLKEKLKAIRESELSKWGEFS